MVKNFVLMSNLQYLKIFYGVIYEKFIIFLKIFKDSEDYTNELFDDLLNRVVHSEVRCFLTT